VSAAAAGIDAATRQRLEATLHALESDRGTTWPLITGIVASVMFHSALLVPQVRQFFAHVNDGIDRSRQAGFSVEREMEKRAPLTPEQMQQEQEDMIRLGIEDGAQQSTMTWIGYKDYQEHLARLSTVEQAAFRDTDEGGKPMTAAREATPQVPQVPQPEPAAPQAPDTSQAPAGEPAPGPAAEAQPIPPTERSPPAQPTPPAAEATQQRPSAPPPPSPTGTAPAPAPEQPPAPPPVTAATRETAPTSDPTAIPIPSADENRVEPTIQPVERAADAKEPNDARKAPLPMQADKALDVPPAPPKPDAQPEAKPAEATPSEPEPPQPTQPSQPTPQQPAPPMQQPQPPAAAPPTQAAPGRQQPSTSPTTGPSPDPSARPGAKPGPKADGDLSDRESDATSVKASPPKDWRPGRPLAQQGLRLRTVRPEIDELTAISGRPMSAVAVIEFDRNGKVRNVTLTESTGMRSWDEALEDSLYRWTADVEKSVKLRSLPPDKTLKFTIKLLLN
jgi:hypothetical protein